MHRGNGWIHEALKNLVHVRLAHKGNRIMNGMRRKLRPALSCTVPAANLNFHGVLGEWARTAMKILAWLILSHISFISFYAVVSTHALVEQTEGLYNGCPNTCQSAW